MTKRDIQEAAASMGLTITRYDLDNWSRSGAISRPAGSRKYPCWPATALEEIAATRALLGQGCGLPEIARLRNLLGPATRGVASLPAALEELTGQGEAAYRHGVAWMIACLKTRLGISAGLRVTMKGELAPDGQLRTCTLDRDSRPEDAAILYLSTGDNLRVVVVANGPAGEQ